MPRSTGRTWTPDTTARLFNMTRNGLTQKQAARVLRRSPKAVERKVAKLRKQIATMPFPQLAKLFGTVETVAFLAQ